MDWYNFVLLVALIGSNVYCWAANHQMAKRWHDRLVNEQTLQEEIEKLFEQLQTAHQDIAKLESTTDLDTITKLVSDRIIRDSRRVRNGT